MKEYGRVLRRHARNFKLMGDFANKPGPHITARVELYEHVAALYDKETATAKTFRDYRRVVEKLVSPLLRKYYDSGMGNDILVALFQHH